MKQSTANIIDEASRLEDIMNYQLFTYEQDRQLWGESDVNWRPGEPLYEHYFDIFFQRTSAAGNIVRPMYELFDDDLPHVAEFLDVVIRCDDCDVSWTGQHPCWACGSTWRMEKEDAWWRMKGVLESYRDDVVSDEAVDEALERATARVEAARKLRRDAMARFAEAMRYRGPEITNSMRNVQAAMVEVTETMRGFGMHIHAIYDVETIGIDSYAPAFLHTLPYIASDHDYSYGYAWSTYVNRSALQSREFVMPDISRRYDPWAEEVDGYLQYSTRENLRAELIRTRLHQPTIKEPKINLGNPHLEEYLAREESGEGYIDRLYERRQERRNRYASTRR